VIEFWDDLFAAIYRVWCRMMRHHPRRVEDHLESFDDEYRAAHPGTPRRIVYGRCARCGAVVEGMTVREIMRMKINPWE
jgi:hypothetical protein